MSTDEKSITLAGDLACPFVIPAAKQPEPETAPGAHAPEPWSLVAHTWAETSLYDGDGERVAELSIRDEEEELQADPEQLEVLEARNDANARRIVAAVNACAGIPTERMEDLGPFVDPINIPIVALEERADKAEARVAELEARESQAATMDKAEKLALIRAIQEIRDAVGLIGNGVSPAQIVAAAQAQQERVAELEAALKTAQSEIFAHAEDGYFPDEQAAKEVAAALAKGGDNE